MSWIHTTAGRVRKWGSDWLLSLAASLTDVTISSPTTDDVLQYNGTAWVNSALDFEAGRETQVAGVSQTVYTLTTISYTVGVGALAVYINGVRQFPSTYTETNSTTVTLSAAPNTGDVVLFEVMGASSGTSTPTFSTVTVTDNLVLSKTSGEGIKVDPATPTFPWHDMLGPIEVRGIGSNDPSYAVFRTSIRQYQFSVNDECWLNFHIPHDYLPGSDLYLHFHWAHNATTVTGGTVTWGYSATYAKGHNQAAFPAVVTGTIAGSASTTQYQHIITEVQLSAGSPSASQLDTDDIEVDGLLLIRAYLSANGITVSSGAAPEPFLFMVDVHYQSTNIGTKQKAPDFYV